RPVNSIRRIRERTEGGTKRGCSAVGRPSFHYAPDGRRYKPPAASKEKLSEKSGGKMPQVPKKAGSRAFPQKEKAPPRGRGGRTRRQKRGKIAFPRRIFRRKGGWKSIPLHCFTFSFVKQGGNCGLVSKESITKQGEMARSRVFRASWTSDGNRDGARLKS